MRVERLQCPHCQVFLKLPHGVTVGRSIACPKCRRPFVVTEPPAQADARVSELDERMAEPVRAGSPPARARRSRAKPARGSVRGSHLAPARIGFSLLALVIIAVCAVGIVRYQKGKGTPATAAGGDTGQARPDADFRVELFDPQATIEVTDHELKAGAHAVLTRRLLVGHYTVRYRIVAGQAAPNKKYMCDISDRGTSLVPVLGKDMQLEGVIEGRSPLLDQTGGPQPATATFKFMTDLGGRWRPISNTITCPIKPYDRDLVRASAAPSAQQPSVLQPDESTAWFKEVGALSLSPRDTHVFSLSRDSKLVATAGWEASEVKLWQLPSGKPRGTFALPKPAAQPFVFQPEVVQSVLLTPDGTQLIAMNNGGTLCIWDTKTGRRQHLLEHLSSHSNLACTPDGQTLVWGEDNGLEGTVQLYDLAAGKKTEQLSGLPGWVRVLTFSLDGKRLAVGSPNAATSVWDFRARRALKTFNPRDQGQNRLALSADGSLLAGTDTTRIRIWDVASGAEKGHMEGTNTTDLGISDDGRYVVGGPGSADRASVWRVADGKLIDSLQAFNQAFVGVSQDSQTIATGSVPAGIHFWQFSPPGPRH